MLSMCSGMIEVRLHEDNDGYIKLIGYPQENDPHLRSSNSPGSSDSDSEHEAMSSSVTNRIENRKYAFYNNYIPVYKLFYLNLLSQILTIISAY